MARQDKRSRMKGLPPRVVLDLLQGVTESVPLSPRATSQGVVLGEQRRVFDDTRALTFGPVGKGVRFLWGTQLVSASRYTTNQEVYTSMSVAVTDPVGNLVKGVSDVWVPPSPVSSPGFGPFVEHNLFAADGKSTEDEFYEVGSALGEVGEGFTSPLWSKTKIELSLPVFVTTSLGWRSGSGTEPLMSYYDHGTGRFQPIGPTKRWDEYYQNVVDGSANAGLYFREKCVGFGPSLNTRGASVSEIRNYGNPVSTWGFPWHEKFLPPSGSMYLPLTRSLTGPFLLEKVVVKLSGSCSPGGYTLGSDGFQGLITVFLLNYSKVGKVSVVESNKLTGTVTGVATVTTTAAGHQHGLGNLDIITWLQVSVTSPGSSSVVTAFEFDRETVRSGSTGGGVTGSFLLPGKVKSPGKHPASSVVFFPTGTAAGLTGNTANYPSYYLASTVSGRTGLPLAHGRNYLEQISGVGEIDPQVFDNTTLRWSRHPSRTNPYWLYPEDNLVIGVQAPVPGDFRTFGVSGVTQGPDLHIPANQVVSVTLYGSYVQDDLEVHDIGNQNLTTPSMCEVVTGRNPR